MQAIEAIKTIKQVNPAKVLIITGWAKRQLGELDTAEKLLLEAVDLNPKSSRGFYELGKVHEEKGESAKAMKAYHKALRLVFGKE